MTWISVYSIIYPILIARETGLEPATSAVTGQRSNQLSYSRNCLLLTVSVFASYQNLFIFVSLFILLA